METIFKVGDKVFDIRWGWGEVVEHFKGDYLIKFHPTNPMLYNEISIQMVSFTEYTLEGFSQERPEDLPKKGQIVWGRDKDYQSWHIYHFSHKTEDGIYHLSSDNKRNMYQLKQITTENPYANEQ